MSSSDPITDRRGNVLDRKGGVIVWEAVEYKIAKKFLVKEGQDSIVDKMWAMASEWWKLGETLEQRGKRGALIKEPVKVGVVFDRRSGKLIVYRNIGEGVKLRGESIMFELDRD